MVYNPISTYRIQFHKGFNFESFIQSIEYFKRLGVKTIYASPIFKAVPGSNHGYDGLNPHEINAEIGSRQQLKEIVDKLKEDEMGWLQDIVPNHMAFHPANEWLMDVLEKGKRSTWAYFFDIDWENKICEGKLMVPFLGVLPDEAISKKELELIYENRRLGIKYFDSFYPLGVDSYFSVIGSPEEKMPHYLRQTLVQMQEVVQTEDLDLFYNRWEEFLLQFSSLMQDTDIRQHIDQCLEKINSDPSLFKKLNDEQHYWLCNWQETDRRINYRRFFTVNGLICVNMQDNNVFDYYHQFIRSFTEEGLFNGLRIDHVDGLYDPENYLQRLRSAAGERIFITIEKILQPGERLPAQWATEGTTGYDFLALVNNLFTSKKAEEKFTSFYEEITGNFQPVYEQLLEKKAFILYHHMGGELDNLHQLLVSIVDRKLLSAIYPGDLKEAIGEFLVHCPVYRFYGSSIPFSNEEMAAVEDVLLNTRRNGKASAEAVDLLRKLFLEKPHEGNEEFNKKLLHFYKRCMQFTGALMAKGLEDTLMYTYNRFIGHNDVGGSPFLFGITKDEFHAAMTERQRTWPMTLNTTATHDTKRGEDARARLNVLTELADEWIDKVREWQQTNQPFKKNIAPDVNEEYFIYQTLFGIWPMPGCENDNLGDRVKEYLQKALREAKTNSSWTEADEEHENAVKDFAGKLIAERSFQESFSSFYNRAVDFGIVNSLAQLVLKFTCPGIPDVYQGCELWDLNLVDPDNRRPVDFSLRMKLLDEIEGAGEKKDRVKELWNQRYDGRIKLWLTNKLLKLRKEQGDLFQEAEYVPLKLSGAYADHVLAFARQYRQKWIVVAVPLHSAELCRQQQATDFFSIDWKDTRISLPARLKQKAEDIFLDGEWNVGKALLIKDLFAQLPLSVLKIESFESQRKAGILLPVSSLPSEFGIGDLGPEAYAFADLLNRSAQKTWQLLPLNPVDATQGYSPYSSISSAAGNVLLISPELLVNEGLLDKKDIEPFHLPKNSKVDYGLAAKAKDEIFLKLWSNVKRNKKHHLWREFRDFSAKEADWLNDFALFLVIKEQQQGKPWFEWPQELKKRNDGVLQSVFKEQKDNLEKIKFLQFIFRKQWLDLKYYCNNKGIEIIGDLPIYVSYDSVDLWSHPEIFSLDSEGKLLEVAGTPPDAFSSEGQLWGMPLFDWDVLKKTNYKWWIERLKRNKLLFDLVRLDHFRAFSAYWAVPASESSSKNGKWKQGPGAGFFETVKKELGQLSFIAEDLGDIDEAVIELREKFNFPGMKVLQFAFDDNMPDSTHIPHNYESNFIAYTGTHDNNTTRGWYKQDIDDATRNRIAQYFCREIKEEDISSEFIRLAYASVAKTVIVPAQDILNLDESARMNKPAAIENNWSWRLSGQFNSSIENKLRELTWLYNRN
jgi:malto-oligosyltrehalose synthase/4-alpha-glucanotransferase